MSTTFKKALEIILILEQEIEGKRDIILGMQKYEAGLEATCRRWADVVDRFVKAGDQLAEASKNKAHRQDWWDAKSHYGIKSK